MTRLLAPALALLLVATAAPRPYAGRRVALVIGISQYSAPSGEDRGGFSPLQYGHSDARRVAERLGQMGWQATLLQSPPGASDSKATKAGILATLAKVSTSPDDTLLIYFAGHGVQIAGKGYVAPFDASFMPKTDERGHRLRDDAGNTVWTPDPKSLLSYDELGEAMREVPALRRLMVFDACKDEPKTSRDGTAPDGGFVQERLGQVVRRSELGQPSWGILASCSSGERSYEDPRLWNGQGGGVFTKGLLDAFASPNSARADGNIVPALVSDALADSVAEWTRANGKRMTPRFTSDIPSGKPIILGSTRSRIAATPPPKVNPPPKKTETRPVRRPQPRPAAVRPAAPGPVVPKRVTPQFERRLGLLGEWRTDHQSAMAEIRVSPDGETVASCGDGGIRLWDANGEIRTSIGGIWASAIAFSADGRQLTAIVDTRICVWDQRTNVVQQVPDRGPKPWKSIDISANGSLIAVGSLGAPAGEPKVVDARSGAPTAQALRGHASSADAVAFSPDGSRVATGGRDGAVNVSRSANGTFCWSYSGPSPVNSIRYSRNGLTVAVGCADRTIVLLDASTGRVKATLRGHTGAVRCVRFSPDGLRLASGADDGTIRIWDVATNRCAMMLSEDERPVKSVDFFPDGKTIASCGDDAAIRVWRVKQ